MSGERDRQLYGDTGTFTLVKLFQDQQGLSTTGELDESTADVLNQSLSGLGAFDQPAQGEFVVRGQVQFADGQVAPGMTLRAFDRDLRSEEKLGEAISDEQGRYQIDYTTDQFSRAEKGSADLRIAVCEPGGRELASSDIQFNAPAEITINLSLPFAQPEPSEYERYLAALEAVLQGLSLAELREDSEHQDITFLSGDTGIATEHLTWLVKSAKLSTLIREGNLKAAHLAGGDIPLAAFYGWFRLGVVTDSDELRLLPINTLRKTLLDAVERKIVPANLRNQIDEILTLIQR